MHPDHATTPDLADPNLWLEDVAGDDALDWVRAHNAPTLAALCDERFETLRAEALEVLDTDARIPYVRRRGALLYNFWRDADHPRGLWRRTTEASYRTAAPVWETVIDVDALAEADGENWVWAGADVIEPDHRLALVSLSRGGADAVVVREFDMTTRDWVPDGFTLPEAKTDAVWEDHDTLLVGTDTGEGSLTDSGYPRTVRRWRRGTPFAESELVFAGESSDVSVGAGVDRTPGFERTVLVRALDFYTRLRFELRDGELLPIDVPADAASVSSHRGWLVVEPRTPWQVGAEVFPPGALVAARRADVLAGTATWTPVFLPDERTSLHQFAWTRDALVVVTLADVASRVTVHTVGDWRAREVGGLPEAAHTVVVDTDDAGEEVMLDSSGFLEPSRLLAGPVTGELEEIKRAPGFFEADGLSVEQHFATSDDGTRIPYFVVGPRERTAPGPTLLGGYGGFEVSRTPSYGGVLGRAWLARGGTYVLANIRGGGEYGPRWHTEAMRENRHRCFEDFAAVARDLVESGVTTVAQLGAQGGSNGGLLMGVMLTSYPELFGALVCSVPLLDMRRYHLLLAGASWTAEYGDPDVPADWAFLSQYSPYQRIRAADEVTYPALLMTTSTRDDRVHPGHARKMTAALEAAGHRVHYWENIEGGHGGAADNAQAAVQSALAYRFLSEVLPARAPSSG